MRSASGTGGSSTPVKQRLSHAQAWLPLNSGHPGSTLLLPAEDSHAGHQTRERKARRREPRAAQDRSPSPVPPPQCCP